MMANLQSLFGAMKATCIADCTPYYRLRRTIDTQAASPRARTLPSHNPLFAAQQALCLDVRPQNGNGTY